MDYLVPVQIARGLQDLEHVPPSLVFRKSFGFADQLRQRLEKQVQKMDKSRRAQSETKEQRKLTEKKTESTQNIRKEKKKVLVLTMIPVRTLTTYNINSNMYLA